MLAETIPAPQCLSFVKHIDGTTCFWAPDRTGTPAELNARGRSYARELQNFIVTYDNVIIYNSVARAMTCSGEYGPVEIGFCTQIGIYLAGIAPR